MRIESASERRSVVEKQNAEKQQATKDRNAALLATDFSTLQNYDDFVANLSATEMKMLEEQNPSYRAARERADYLASPAGQAELASQREAEVEAQVQRDREAAEAAEAARQPGTNEVLFDGVEKLGPGSYRLTVPSVDGGNSEVFYGNSQAELFAKLRKSKGHATAEIRRRSKSVQITQEMRNNSQVEKINYPPLVEKLTLTPDEIYDLTEKLKDPVHILEAQRKLRLASLSDEEIGRENEAIIQRRQQDAYNTAANWVKAHPEFHRCPENIKAMQELMLELDWAVTPNNMNLAYQELVKQGVLIEKPAEAPTRQSAPAAISTTPAAPVKVLRPASNSTSLMPTRRTDSVNLKPPKPTLTVEEYNKMPADDVRRRYKRDAEFRAAVDDLMAQGKI